MRQETAPKTAARRRAGFAAFLWSLTAVPVGLWQLLDPDGGPFAEPTNAATVGLPGLLEGAGAPLLLMAAGIAGLFLARASRALWPVTAAYTVVFGMLIPTTSVISLVGYLVTFCLPVFLVTAPVLFARGKVGRLVAAGAVAAVIAALAAAGPLDPAVIGSLLRNLGSGVGDLGLYPLTELWSAAGGACWLAMTARLLLDARAGETPRWLTPEGSARWGRRAAYLAFACSLPYGLTRLTWLTPWPYLMDAEALAAHPDMRVWGLLLGFACLGGGVLCLGLAARWGERWPYWVPALAGRPVPPAAAIVPASIVSYLFTITGVPFIPLAFEAGHPELIAVFPFLPWGGALAAATLAYAIRRGAVRTEAAN
ncbi:hypothetical protein [Glycomyces tarimensis]